MVSAFPPFEVALFPSKSYSYSMKWYSYSYSKRLLRVRVRVPPMAEYEYENTGFLKNYQSDLTNMAQLQKSHPVAGG